MAQPQELIEARDKSNHADGRQKQLESMFEEINRQIFTCFGLNETVDADSCSVWMLELLKALEEKKVC